MEKNCPTCYEEKCNNCSVYKGTRYLNNILKGFNSEEQIEILNMINANKIKPVYLTENITNSNVNKRAKMLKTIDSNVLLMKKLELNRLNPAC